MHQVFADIRHGVRLMARAPGVTATVLLTLALAIGANSAMFSVVHAVLLRPLPYEQPERLVMVWEDVSRIGFPKNTPAPANWMDWREQNTVFTDIAATRGGTLTLTGVGDPERLLGRRVTASFWSILGAKPLLGRTFTEEEDRKSAKVAVIGYGLWQRRFGGERSILGRKVLLDGEPYEVIGVMPPRFAFPTRRQEIWTPAAFTPEDLAARGSHFLQCVARLKPGVSVEQSQKEMSFIAKRLEERYPETNEGVGAVVEPMSEYATGTARLGLIVLFAASGLVLVIACANIANLLLARATAREQEIAVRTALGAKRTRIVRQLLTESLLMAALGAGLGVFFARAAMLFLERLIPAEMAVEHLTLDWSILLFTAAVTTAVGIAFGLFPAMSLRSVEVNRSIRSGGRGLAGGIRTRLRDGLVVAQTALALALLTGAALMLQTLRNLGEVDLGMRTEKVLTLATVLPPTRYSTHAQQETFVREVLEKVTAIPGVVDCGYTSALPLTQIGNTSGYLIFGRTDAAANEQDALFRVVTPGFFPAIGASLREGRFLTDQDRAGSQPVVLINETFANMHWPGRSPLGERISMSGSGPNQNWLSIVGVVKEIRERGVTLETKPAVYMSLAQSEGYWPDPSDLLIRTSVTDPLSIAPAIRRAIGAVDRDQAVSDLRTMNDVFEEQTARPRKQLWLLGAFAGLAVLLAETGIYGVISYLVSQRRREIGVRMALGATPAAVMRMVFSRAAGLLLVGLATGLALSIAAASLLRQLLFGIEPQDPLTIALASLILLGVGVTASFLPARQASAVDPAVVLRDE